MSKSKKDQCNGYAEDIKKSLKLIMTNKYAHYQLVMLLGKHVPDTICNKTTLQRQNDRMQKLNCNRVHLPRQSTEKSITLRLLTSLNTGKQHKCDKMNVECGHKICCKIRTQNVGEFIYTQNKNCD